MLGIVETLVYGFYVAPLFNYFERVGIEGSGTDTVHEGGGEEMTRLLGGFLVVTAIVVAAGLASAQMGGGGMGSGMMGSGMMGSGMMGSGMMGSGMQNQAGGPAGRPDASQTSITEDRARELAQQYADTYLKNFKVDQVLPFSGMHGTMYSVELKGPDDQIRVLHVNPWGSVMPFGGPSRRTS